MSAPNDKDNKPKEKLEDLLTFARKNTRDTIAYIILIIGLIMLFFYTFWGGLLIGLVIGVYFAPEIIYAFKNSNALLREYGMVRALILGALALAILIAIPSMILGIAIAVALNYLIAPQ